MKKQLIIGAGVVAIALAAFSVDKLLLHTKAKTKIVSSPVSAQSNTHVAALAPKAAASPAAPNYVADMNNVIAGYPQFSAAATLVDLDNGQEYDAGATGTIFDAASTAKVLAAVDYLHQVEVGQATLDQIIDGASAEQLIQQMIEISDNIAWLDIDYFLGNQQQDYAHSIGMTSFTGGDSNTMTVADEAKLLVQLYQGKLINQSDRSLLYGYMQNSDGDSLITDALPANALVYHKYGQLYGYLNDMAIVNYQNHNFVLVIYSNNPDGTMDDYSNQVALIHAITGAAFKDITAND